MVQQQSAAAFPSPRSVPALPNRWRNMVPEILLISASGSIPVSLASGHAHALDLMSAWSDRCEYPNEYL